MLFSLSSMVRGIVSPNHPTRVWLSTLRSWLLLTTLQSRYQILVLHIFAKETSILPWHVHHLCLWHRFHVIYSLMSPCLISFLRLSCYRLARVPRTALSAVSSPCSLHLTFVHARDFLLLRALSGMGWNRCFSTLSPPRSTQSCMVRNTYGTYERSPAPHSGRETKRRNFLPVVGMTWGEREREKRQRFVFCRDWEISEIETSILVANKSVGRSHDRQATTKHGQNFW